MKKLYYTLAYIILLGIPSLVLSKFVDVELKSLVFTVLASIVVGQVLEIWAVRHGKKDRSFVWDYSSKFILGPKIFDIPIEDFILFLILTPIFIVYFYEFINTFI
ncbi:MAG: lycopene cyclase domain-containing protein [Patescibacteria group bacterium]